MLVAQLPSLGTVSASGALRSSQPLQTLRAVGFRTTGSGRKFLGNGFSQMPRSSSGTIQKLEEGSASWPRLFPRLVPTMGTGTARQEPRGPRAVFPEALPPSTPMLLRQLRKLSRAQRPSVPVSWGLGRTSTALAEGTEGLCVLLSCPQATPPWEPESAPLSGPRATPQELSRGLRVPVAGEPSPRLCVIPGPEARRQSPGQSWTPLWSRRQSRTVAPLGAHWLLGQARGCGRTEPRRPHWEAPARGRGRGTGLSPGCWPRGPE